MEGAGLVPVHVVMSAEDSTMDLFQRCQAGDQSACDEFYRRYTERLVVRARGLIGDRLAGRLDPEEVVQSALGSFLRGYKDRPFQGGQLWALLVTILKNKIRTAAIKRVAEGLPPDLPDSSSGPEEHVVFTDAVEAAVEGFSSRDVTIVMLWLFESYRIGEIATEVGCGRHTVRRVLNRFLDRFRDYFSDNSEPPEDDPE